MADEGAVPYGRKTQHFPLIAEVSILWITAGLGCDADTVSITAGSRDGLGPLVDNPRQRLSVIAAEIGCHRFRATGITAYLSALPSLCDML